MRDRHAPVFLARFCGNCDCGCPELYVDPSADADRRVVITDDFGQRVEMSLDQFRDLVEMAKSGTLDDLLDRRVTRA
ncbi:hypothetical protein AB0K60_29990 [Thermopolyspora sp. NPDC052614]|uniref:hypothetical protein n=1 Tax=Thermopolyspora sp. NPDC052614 TaxID=3155682 RepID=UPI00341A34FF